MNKSLVKLEDDEFKFHISVLCQDSFSGFISQQYKLLKLYSVFFCTFLFVYVESNVLIFFYNFIFLKFTFNLSCEEKRFESFQNIHYFTAYIN